MAREQRATPKTATLATFLRKLANRLDDEGDLIGAERLRDLAYNTPRMARALDEMVEQSRISERTAFVAWRSSICG